MGREKDMRRQVGREDPLTAGVKSAQTPKSPITQLKEPWPVGDGVSMGGLCSDKLCQSLACPPPVILSGLREGLGYVGTLFSLPPRSSLR